MAKWRVRYTSTVWGQCNGKLHNGRICVEITIWFYNGCTRINKKFYYCTHLGHESFSNHIDSLIYHCWHICYCRSIDILLCFLFDSFVTNNNYRICHIIDAIFTFMVIRLHKKAWYKLSCGIPHVLLGV